MPEDPTINPDPVADPVADPVDPDPVVDPTAEPQTPDDPLRLSPEMQSRHKSAADLEAFAKQQQSEADTIKREFEEYKRQHPDATQTQPPPPTTDEVLEKLARDPVGFVNEEVNKAVMPLAAQVGLNIYADNGHPEVKNPEFKQAMEAVIKKNPALINTEDGLDYAYFKVKNQMDAAKKVQANSIIQAQNAEVQTVKKAEAFVEGATATKPQASPKILPGMSRAESEKILDAQNIGWVKDEDREEYY